MKMFAKRSASQQDYVDDIFNDQRILIFVQRLIQTVSILLRWIDSTN